MCSQIVIGTVPHNCNGLSRKEKGQRKKKWANSTQVTFIELLAAVQQVSEWDYNPCPLVQVHFTCNNGYYVNAYWVGTELLGK